MSFDVCVFFYPRRDKNAGHLIALSKLL